MRIAHVGSAARSGSPVVLDDGFVAVLGDGARVVDVRGEPADAVRLYTLAELPPVAPETDMISPASVSLRLAAAALSPTTFGTMHSSVDFSAPR